MKKGAGKVLLKLIYLEFVFSFKPFLGEVLRIYDALILPIRSVTNNYDFYEQSFLK